MVKIENNNNQKKIIEDVKHFFCKQNKNKEIDYGFFVFDKKKNFTYFNKTIKFLLIH